MQKGRIYVNISINKISMSCLSLSSPFGCKNGLYPHFERPWWKISSIFC